MELAIIALEAEFLTILKIHVFVISHLMNFGILKPVSNAAILNIGIILIWHAITAHSNKFITLLVDNANIAQNKILITMGNFARFAHFLYITILQPIHAYLVQTVINTMQKQWNVSVLLLIRFQHLKVVFNVIYRITSILHPNLVYHVLKIKYMIWQLVNAYTAL